MSKIILFDTWNLKFAAPIVGHWRKQGHQVLVNPQYEAMTEADLTFCYQADNCAIEAALKPRRGKLFIQCVDIEVWAGQANAIDWSKVDGVFYMAKHIKDMVGRDGPVIKPGIDINRFTLKTKVNDSPIKRIAYVVGDRRIWDVKRLDIAFQILKDLIDDGKNTWQLHVRGTYSSHEQYNAYCRYLEKDLKLGSNVIWYLERIEDMNKWLEDKDYILVPSTKEAFSYATAEAMAKGIKPVLNNWEGSRDTWGKYVCDTQGQMVNEFLRGEYKSEEYRKFVVDNYSQDRYLNELNKFLGIGVMNI